MAAHRGHRWFAAMYDRLMATGERGHMGHVRQQVAGAAAGRVLELGAGTGLNFPYYSTSAHVVALEPDPFMLRRAVPRARAGAARVTLCQGRAEALPFANDTFDEVVATLVMCTVDDPMAALDEVRRVLKPGGRFRFYEHVRDANPLLAACQDLVTPFWRWLGAGCHPNRDFLALLRRAGFQVRHQELSYPAPAVPPALFARPHVQGVAHP